MELTLQRINRGTDSTLGAMLIGKGLGGYCHSWTCEDERRNTKVMNETRIPAGRYEIKLRTAGGFHKRYATKYPNVHVGMLHLQDVPNFTYIYIHPGNNEKDTSGCILVGYTASNDTVNGGGTIGRSVDAYLNLYGLVTEALGQNEKVFITVKDEELL